MSAYGRTRLVLLMLPALAACGRDWTFLDGASAVEHDASAPPGEPPSPVAQPSSPEPGPDPAPTAVPACDPLAPFDAPVSLAELNTEVDEESAVLSDDELRIYFARGTFGQQLDIYTASRARRTDTFGQAHPLEAIGTGAQDLAPAPTADLLTMYVDSYRGGRRSLQMSRRASKDGAFGAPTRVRSLSSANEDGMPYVLAGGRVLYFSSSRIDGHFDIFRAENVGAAVTEDRFSEPEQVPGINDTMWFDGYPVVSPDELTIYFGTAREKSGYLTDIYVSRRASRVAAWEKPSIVTDLQDVTPHNYPSWISPDGCRLYFTSSRTTDHHEVSLKLDAPKDLWMATRRH